MPNDAYLATNGIVLTPDPLADSSAIDPPPNAQCSAALPPGTYHDVTIPPHQTCTLSPGVHVTNDVTGQTDSTLIVFFGGVTVDHDVVMQNARNLLFSGGNRVGHDFRVNGMNGANGTQTDSPICNTFIGHDLVVRELASGNSIQIGDTSLFCGFSIEVGHDVRLDNNAGLVDAVITGGGGVPPAGFTPCTDTYGAASVGHDLEASGNTGTLIIRNANICHDLNVSNNSGTNSVTLNTAGDDANCSNNSPVVAGNMAADKNNGCA